ncbi:TPA: hypothetical protein OWU14_002634 [Staphylococcus aureus]|nr:hypothetical protein [Staphylococcus aureus]
MILSKTANKILKELKNKEKYFSNLCIENRDVNSSKLTYKEIKDKFPDTSHIVISMTVKYLLEKNLFLTILLAKRVLLILKTQKREIHNMLLVKKG